MSGAIVVISQPRYLPAMNYLHRMKVADVFVYLDMVQYTPRDWENRNRICFQGRPAWLTVPVKHRGRAQKISDTEVDNGQIWGQKHLKSLHHAYGKAKYFADHFPYFEMLYSQTWTHLIDLNAHIVEYACRYLGIGCRFVRASSLQAQGQGEDLLMDLCRKVDARVYLSGSLGRNYIHPERWKEAGIGLAFHDYAHPSYDQGGRDFVPWMAFPDLFMHGGSDSGWILSSGNPTRDDIVAGSCS